MKVKFNPVTLIVTGIFIALGLFALSPATMVAETTDEAHLVVDLNRKDNSQIEGNTRWWKLNLSPLPYIEHSESMEQLVANGNNILLHRSHRSIDINNLLDKIEVTSINYEQFRSFNNMFYAFGSYFLLDFAGNKGDKERYILYSSLDGKNWVDSQCKIPFLGSMKKPKRVEAEPKMIASPDYGNIDGEVKSALIKPEIIYKKGNKYFIQFLVDVYQGTDKNGNNRFCSPSDKAIASGVLINFLASSTDLHEWKLEKTNIPLDYSNQENHTDMKSFNKYKNTVSYAFFGAFGDVLNRKKYYITYMDKTNPKFKLVDLGNVKYIQTEFWITDRPKNGIGVIGGKWRPYCFTAVFKVDTKGAKMIYPFNVKTLKESIKKTGNFPVAKASSSVGPPTEGLWGTTFHNAGSKVVMLLNNPQQKKELAWEEKNNLIVISSNAYQEPYYIWHNNKHILSNQDVLYVGQNINGK